MPAIAKEFLVSFIWTTNALEWLPASISKVRQRIQISTSRFVSNSFSDVVRSLCEDSRYPTTLDWGCFIQVSIFLV